MAKPTKPSVDLDEVPDDVRRRVIEDFGADLAEDIYRHLLDRIPAGLPNGTRPRHLRCILHLAKGDRASLDHYIEMCLQDPRDVMLNAEYELRPGSDVRVRDFGKAFDQAEFPKRKRASDR